MLCIRQIFPTSTFFILAMLCLNVYANDTKYNIEDLRVLHTQNALHEFFQHALDIRPSQRKGEWDAMIEDMGDKLINKLNKSSVISKKEQELVFKISKWPFFAASEVFISKRDQVLIKIIKQCYTNAHDNCLDKAHKLYRDYEHEYSFSFQFIKVLKENQTPNKVLWPYIKTFAQSKFSEFYCHKSPLKETITEKMIQNAWNKRAAINIHPDCLAKIIPDLKQKLITTDTQYRKSIYRILKDYGKLESKDISKYYLLQYLDDNLSESDSIDRALNQLNKISEDFKLRDSIQKELLKSEILPGKLFKGSRSKAKTRLLFRHFPEYIDLYAKTCLSYLKGTQTYPKGNPTPECHDFFSLNSELQILPNHLKSEYKKATSFAIK